VVKGIRIGLLKPGVFLLSQSLQIAWPARLKQAVLTSCCEEKEIFGANNRDTGSVHQNGCWTEGARRRVVGRASTETYEREALEVMATYRDPVRCFAPLEVVERLLEIRAEAGYAPAIFLLSPDDLAACLDAYGFDVYAFSDTEAAFHFGDYRAPLAPGGDHAHNSLTAH
jgi:hypothetical protein